MEAWIKELGVAQRDIRSWHHERHWRRSLHAERSELASVGATEGGGEASHVTRRHRGTRWSPSSPEATCCRSRGRWACRTAPGDKVPRYWMTVASCMWGSYALRNGGDVVTVVTRSVATERHNMAWRDGRMTSSHAMSLHSDWRCRNTTSEARRAGGVVLLEWELVWSDVGLNVFI